MRKDKIIKQLQQVSIEVSKEISGFACDGGLHAHGLAGEGYNGGYRDALYDVILFLNGVKTNRNYFWEGTEGM